MNTLTDADIWSLLVGAGMPPIVALLIRVRWQPWQKAVTAAAVSIAGGGVTAWLGGYMHGMTAVRCVLVVLLSTLAFYRLWWRPSGIAPAIEKATSPAVGTGRHELYERFDDDEAERQLRRS